jgi:hypothetical protein
VSVPKNDFSEVFLEAVILHNKTEESATINLPG